LKAHPHFDAAAYRHEELPAMTVRVATPPAARRRIADHKAASWRKRQPIEVEGGEPSARIGQG